MGGVDFEKDERVIDRAWELYRQARHNVGDIARRGWFDDRLWSKCMQQAVEEHAKAHLSILR